ncbi:hypothetical protein ACF09C_20795 [Streptomyces sp. NPDC014870]|uniref:hypothetical protein n=1 Tax=Streptomyces sp. NPDC014870 TaxID=3364925 RepID=UPI0036FC6972
MSASSAGAGVDEHGVLRLPEGSWRDWTVAGHDGSRLRLVAGYDLAYHYGLELVFTDASYVLCPFDFLDPEFRAPTVEERAKIARLLGEEPAVLVAFEADGGGTEPASCLIAAETLDVVVGRFPRVGASDVG